MAALKNSMAKLRRLIGIRRDFLGHRVVGRLRPVSRSQSNDNSSLDRLEACHVLWKHEIPVVIWLEDLLTLHDSLHNHEGDLNLLVPNPQQAAKVLQEFGYQAKAHHLRFNHEPEFAERGVRMTRGCEETGIVLLPAQDWYYDLDHDVQDFLPSLNLFLDSMIEFWLNISSKDYVDRLSFALYIGQLISDCYRTRIPGRNLVKDPAFAENLKPTHREVHYDIVSEDPDAESFTVTRRHQYHVRRSREIAEGLFRPQPYKQGLHRPNLTTLHECD